MVERHIDIVKAGGPIPPSRTYGDAFGFFTCSLGADSVKKKAETVAVAKSACSSVVEHFTDNEKVVGSIPTTRTKQKHSARRPAVITQRSPSGVFLFYLTER